MPNSLNIKERTPIWMALSDFYLDTELQATDFRHIAIKIMESPYTFAEVKTINKYEVFPVLQSNLMSVAGAWEGYNEAWLVDNIQTALAERTALKTIGIESSYFTLKWMCAAYWTAVEAIYNTLKSNPES